jgi:hypothetical protein
MAEAIDTLEGDTPKQLQFQFSYAGDEDRLLLRGTFPTGQSMSVWLTRRVTFGLFEGAEAISGAVKAPAAPREVKQAIAAFERQAAAAKADTKTPFRPAAPHPTLGDEVKLVVKIALSAQGDKLIKVVLTTKDKLDLTFNLPRQSFLQLWSAMDRVVTEQAGWRVGPASATPSIVGGSATRH